MTERGESDITPHLHPYFWDIHSDQLMNVINSLKVLYKFLVVEFPEQYLHAEGYLAMVITMSYNDLMEYFVVLDFNRDLWDTYVEFFNHYKLSTYDNNVWPSNHDFEISLEHYMMKLVKDYNQSVYNMYTLEGNYQMQNLMLMKANRKVKLELLHGMEGPIEIMYKTILKGIFQCLVIMVKTSISPLYNLNEFDVMEFEQYYPKGSATKFRDECLRELKHFEDNVDITAYDFLVETRLTDMVYFLHEEAAARIWAVLHIVIGAFHEKESERYDWTMNYFFILFYRYKYVKVVNQQMIIQRYSTLMRKYMEMDIWKDKYNSYMPSDEDRNFEFKWKLMFELQVTDLPLVIPRERLWFIHIEQEAIKISFFNEVIDNYDKHNLSLDEINPLDILDTKHFDPNSKTNQAITFKLAGDEDFTVTIPLEMEMLNQLYLNKFKSFSNVEYCHANVEVLLEALNSNSYTSFAWKLGYKMRGAGDEIKFPTKYWGSELHPLLNVSFRDYRYHFAISAQIPEPVFVTYNTKRGVRASDMQVLRQNEIAVIGRRCGFHYQHMSNTRRRIVADLLLQNTKELVLGLVSLYGGEESVLSLRYEVSKNLLSYAGTIKKAALSAYLIEDMCVIYSISLNNKKGRGYVNVAVADEKFNMEIEGLRKQTDKEKWEKAFFSLISRHMHSEKTIFNAQTFFAEDFSKNLKEQEEDQTFW